jgi:DNA-binding transcriptional ArsR family regulator
MTRRSEVEHNPLHDRDAVAGTADIFRILSHAAPHRILGCLGRKEKTLAEISRSLGLLPEDVLPWLSVLQKKGLLISCSGSRTMRYRMTDAEIFRSLDLIRRISGRKLERPRTENTDWIPSKSPKPSERRPSLKAVRSGLRRGLPGAIFDKGGT